MNKKVFLELVEGENGSVCLHRVDADGSKELLSIQFSSLTYDLLQQLTVPIAQAMIEAGLDAFTELADESIFSHFFENDGREVKVTLH